MSAEGPALTPTKQLGSTATDGRDVAGSGR